MGMSEPSLQTETLLAMLESLIEQDRPHDELADTIEEFFKCERNKMREECIVLVEVSAAHSSNTRVHQHIAMAVRDIRATIEKE